MALDIYFHKTKVTFKGNERNDDDLRDFTSNVDEEARKNLKKRIKTLIKPLREAWKEVSEKENNEYWRGIYNSRYFEFVEKLRPIIAKNYYWKIHPYTKGVIDLPELEQMLEKQVEDFREQYDAYFRKVNFIFHYFEVTVKKMRNQWFAFVTPEDIDGLIDRCEQVLHNHDLAESLLATQEGFFFGSTDYNKWYFDDVKDCLKQMRKYRKLLKDGVTGYAIFSW